MTRWFYRLYFFFNFSLIYFIGGVHDGNMRTESLQFQIEENDYFGTLAALLTQIAQASPNSGSYADMRKLCGAYRTSLFTCRANTALRKLRDKTIESNYCCHVVSIWCPYCRVICRNPWHQRDKTDLF
jgi:hypothetical protein